MRFLGLVGLIITIGLIGLFLADSAERYVGEDDGTSYNEMIESAEEAANSLTR